MTSTVFAGSRAEAVGLPTAQEGDGIHPGGSGADSQQCLSHQLYLPRENTAPPWVRPWPWIYLWTSIIVKLQLFEVIGTIFTSQNHLKCEFHSHYCWFWLVKIPPTTRIRVQKVKDVISSQCTQIIRYSLYPCLSYQCFTDFFPRYYPLSQAFLIHNKYRLLYILRTLWN